jgi:kinetochore protein NDC80
MNRVVQSERRVMFRVRRPVYAATDNAVYDEHGLLSQACLSPFCAFGLVVKSSARFALLHFEMQKLVRGCATNPRRHAFSTCALLSKQSTTVQLRRRKTTTHFQPHTLHSGVAQSADIQDESGHALVFCAPPARGTYLVPHPCKDVNIDIEQTLGSVNTNASAIPMPASAMKRSNSGGNLQGAYTQGHARSMSGGRLSLMPNRPNQPVFRASDAPMSTHRASTSVFPSAASQSVRKSYAPMSQSTPGNLLATPGANSFQRRSSAYSARPSSGPGSLSRQSFFATAPPASGLLQDPRRLRDKAFNEQMRNELLDYFTKNNFEMESQISLSQRTMISPTQKEFNMMFQWLYRRIDPGYHFMKSMDTEIPPLLKQLRYPFEKSITKSQIAAVGGNNWHTFLGLLHWIMQLAAMMDAYSKGEYDHATAESGKDVSGDRIIFDFLSGAYQDWLNVPDNADEDAADQVVVQHVERMAARFREVNKDLLDDVDILEAEKKSLTEQIEELERNTEKSRMLDERLELLKGDTVNYEQWNGKVDNKIKKYNEKIARLEEELRNLDKEYQDAESEKSTHQEAISQQGITIQDLDRMSSETDRLEKAREAIRERLDEAKQRVAEKEAEASKKLDELERFVERYNALGYKIGLIPSTAMNAKGVEYELSLTVNNSEPADFLASQMSRSGSQEPDLRLLKDATTGYLPYQLLNLDLKGTVKNNIVTLRKAVSERRNKALEEDMKNHEMLDGVKEAMDEKRAEVDGLGHRIRGAEEEFEKTREVC